MGRGQAALPPEEVRSPQLQWRPVQCSSSARTWVVGARAAVARPARWPRRRWPPGPPPAEPYNPLGVSHGCALPGVSAGKGRGTRESRGTCDRGATRPRLLFLLCGSALAQLLAELRKPRSSSSQARPRADGAKAGFLFHANMTSWPAASWWAREGPKAASGLPHCCAWPPIRPRSRWWGRWGNVTGPSLVLTPPMENTAG